ncbi:MAG: hypothetical protein ACREP7_19815 [Lysobacter sp.]
MSSEQAFAVHFGLSRLLLGCLAACAASVAWATPPANEVLAVVPDERPAQMSPGKPGKPATACPSGDFNVFLKAFANRGDVQLAYTAQPYRVKRPYYWTHQTEAGDPKYPRWDIQKRHGAASVNYRFDSETQAYVFDSAMLAADEDWQRPEQAALKPRRISGFKTKRISSARFEVTDGGFVDSYIKKSGCWYFEQSWAFEPLAFCKWPDQCKRWRE